MHVSVIRAQRMHVVVLVVLLSVALPVFAYTQSGFYRYIDVNGQVRYTDNPANVPPDQYQDKPQDPNTRPEADIPKHDLPAAQRIVVNFDAKGGLIFVHAVLDRHFPVIFQLDTGATSSMITESDARMLNIPIEPSNSVRGLIADGSIVEMPVVHLASIGVGEALVENLDVTIGKLRLLGMDFLGNFELNIDAQVGQMVLVAKDPELKTNGLKREPESDAIQQDREHAKRDIDSQITQLTLAIKTCHSVIQEYRDNIEDLEMERQTAESELSSARNQTRFQGSGVSRDKGNESAISQIEKNIAEIEAVIQNRFDLIKIQGEKVTGMQSRINYLQTLRSRIN
jgi:prefoldin subunit 5